MDETCHQVSWEDVQEFCKHTKFLEPLCGRQFLPDDWKTVPIWGIAIKPFLIDGLSFDDFPLILMSAVDEMKSFEKERIISWNIIAFKVDNEYCVGVRVYFK